MKTNQLNQVIVSEDDFLEVMYRDQNISQLVVDQPDWIVRFNQNCQKFDLPFLVDWQEESQVGLDQFIQENLADWRLPDEYKVFDLEDFLLNRCDTEQQVERVLYELNEFKQRNMMIVLVWLKYFVDTMRSNNLVWGVGRGSSVASYVLFLLDVHRVDSLKYDLDIKEFLK